MWSGTDHWDELLMQRAEISGKRVLSDFTRKTIEKLKKGDKQFQLFLNKIIF